MEVKVRVQPPKDNNDGVLEFRCPPGMTRSDVDKLDTNGISPIFFRAAPGTPYTPTRAPRPNAPLDDWICVIEFSNDTAKNATKSRVEAWLLTFGHTVVYEDY